MLAIVGTLEETDNVIEMMAISGACDSCPALPECKKHSEPDNSEWEELSCGEVIRHNVNIITKGAKAK